MLYGRLPKCVWAESGISIKRSIKRPIQKGKNRYRRLVMPGAYMRQQSQIIIAFCDAPRLWPSTTIATTVQCSKWGNARLFARLCTVCTSRVFFPYAAYSRSWSSFTRNWHSQRPLFPTSRFLLYTSIPLALKTWRWKPKKPSSLSVATTVSSAVFFRFLF